MVTTGAIEAEETQPATVERQRVRKLPPLVRTFELAGPTSPLEDDELVVQLREWGSDKVFSLESLGYHALSSTESMEWDGERWWVRRLSSDGASRRSVVTAGTELRLESDRMMIAETRRSIALRDVCRRLMGWRTDRQHAVDRSVRSIRFAASNCGPIVILGSGELSSVARSLHRVLRGPSAPFVGCNPSCNDLRTSAIVAPNLRNVQEACEAAAGGSLVVRTGDMPRDFSRISHAFVQGSLTLFVCATDKSSFRFDGFPHVDLRDFDDRRGEIPRLIDEYAKEAGDLLRAPEGCFREQDRDWVMMYSASSIVEIERGTLYQTALRMTRTPREAARMLGVSEGTLAMYLNRRSSR